MPRISDASSPKAQDLARYIDAKYGNRSGILSSPEANRAIRAMATDPELKAKMADLFATPPARAKDLIKVLFSSAPPPPPAGSAIGAGSRAGGPGEVFLQLDGNFSIGQRPAGTGPLASAPALYEAALLVSAGKNPYANAPTAVKARAAGALEEAARLGAERSAREPKASEATMQLKSGSATALLALAEAASGPGEAEVRQKAIGTYLAIAEKEIHRGLKTSMAINLDAAKGKLGLTADQVKQVEALMTTALPEKPPYDEWFKNGNNTVNFKHYVHEEFYEQLKQPYVQRGFEHKVLSPGREVFEKVIKDPSGRAPDTKFHVEIFKVEDYSTDRQMLRDMNDPNVQVEMYTGHSNLGGNIAMALRAAPKTETGTKLVQLGMCRGKQNVAEFSNRFPNAHLVTTSAPEYGYGINAMTNGMIDMIAGRKGYDELKKVRTPGDYMVPNDKRLYDHRDFDGDGKVDGGAQPDRVFDIYPRAPRGQATDFKPGPAIDPAKVDGGPALNALAFSNTLLTYHVEHGDGRSPISGKYTDKMIGDGFYQSAGNEFLKVTPETVNGDTVYRVAVNSKYANQAEDVVGMRTIYELNRYITEKEKGTSSLDDKARGMLLASEWLAYMVGQGDYSEQLVKSMGKTYGWPPSVTHAALASALAKDQHGYVSTDSVNALKQALGSSLGDGSNIQ